jgi:hypothetical protein
MNPGDMDKKYLESIRASVRILGFFHYGFLACALILLVLTVVHSSSPNLVIFPLVGSVACCGLACYGCITADRLEARLRHEGVL